MQSKYQEIKILENYIQNMNCFSWIKLIPVLIHLKYWYYSCPYLELPCLPHHLCQSLSQPTEANIPSSCYSLVSVFVLPHSTTHCHKYLIYQTICEAKPVKFIIKLYTDHDSLCLKHATYQKAQSLRAFRQHVKQHTQ